MLKNGDKVIVHSLGNACPGEFPGVIRGYSVKPHEDERIKGFGAYIVELDAGVVIDPDYHYPMINITDACIRKI